MMALLSIDQYAAQHNFRGPRRDESPDAYRDAVIAHLDRYCTSAAYELRFGAPQAEWTDAQRNTFKDDLLGRWQKPGTGPSDYFHRPVTVLEGFQTQGRSVTDDELRRLANDAINVLVAWRTEARDDNLPVVASVLLIDGRQFTAFVDAFDRKAILNTWAATEPVYGYFLVADSFLHRINVDKTTQDATKTETVDALICHIGSRSGIRRLVTRPYTVRHGRVEWELPEDHDKTANLAGDPYADIFAHAFDPKARPQ